MPAVAPKSETADKIRKGRAEREASYERASAKRLSKEQPVTTANPDWAPSWWGEFRTHAEARLNQLRAWRFSWAEHWSLLETYILPRRGIFINAAQPTPNAMIRGLPINQNIVDPTGTQAMRVCAAGLMSGLMSPSRPWFKLKPALFAREDADPDAQAWFEEVEDRMYTILGRSNFYDSGTQMFEDLTVFGTGPVIIYEDEIDVIRCYVPCPGEYLLAVGPNGRVQTLYRQFNMTISQIVEMFGLNNCPRSVQEMWYGKGGSLENEMLVAHSIEPNFPVQKPRAAEVGVIPGDFAYREVYWVWGSSDTHPLSLRGFKDPPHICPRWAVTSNDAYGRSVGMDVLPDIMQLQQETRRKAEAIEKMVRPPLLGDMSLKNEPSSVLPGHVTWVQSLDSGKGMRPVYEVKPEIEEMMQDLKEIQARIKTGFFNDLFLMLSQMDGVQPRNELELNMRQMEKIQVLGPVIERFENEGATPAIQRVFQIMKRKGLLPPLPKSLVGIPLGIEYVSMMRLAQRAAQTAGLEQYGRLTIQLAQVWPEARFTLNPAAFLAEYREQLSVPAKVVNTPQQVQQLMQQQQQQQAAAQAAETLPNAASKLAGAASDLGNVDVGGGLNAIQMMLGQGAPGQGGAALTGA